MGYPRQGYRSELPYPPPGDLPNPGIEPKSPALAGGFSTTGPPGNPRSIYSGVYLLIPSFWCFFSPCRHLPTSTLVTISLFSMFAETRLWHLLPGEWCGWMIIHTRTCAPWFPFIALGWRPSLSHGVEGPAHARAGSVPSRPHHFTLHPSFSLSMHAVFSLTSRSGIRGTLLLKRSVQMPSPSQSLRIYDQSRKGPHLESFPESQVSSKFSLACFCSIWSLLPWHVSTFWFSMCVCLLNRELYSLCCIPRHWLCAYHIAGTQYLTKEWLKENSALIFFFIKLHFLMR